MNERPAEVAARRGEPSYVWRAGQERRLRMILEAAGPRARGVILVDGCGIGTYLERLGGEGGRVYGLDVEWARVQEAKKRGQTVIQAEGEDLPFEADSFDLILSHEVLEHVRDDRAAVREMVRTLGAGGRIVIFAPNRGYPFETHGVYWRGRYRFGNIPLVNYLPRPLRDRLAPHVRAYGRADLEELFADLPVRFVRRTVIFGAYDNIIARWSTAGRLLRAVLQGLERTPLRVIGLSHFWVVEKSEE